MADDDHLIERQLEGLRRELVRLRRILVGGFVVLGLILAGGLYLPADARITFAMFGVIFGGIVVFIGTIYMLLVSWWRSVSFRSWRERLSIRWSERG